MNNKLYCLGILAMMTLSLCARGQTVEPDNLILTERGGPISVASQAFFFLDDSNALTVEDISAQRESFQPLPETNIDFGFSDATIWLWFKVHNGHNESLSRILQSDVRFMRPLNFYQSQGAGWQQLLINTEHHTFHQRPLPELRFLAAEFAVAAGQSSDFLVQFAAEGPTAMDLQILDREAALTEQFQATVRISIYASILLTLILVNFLHFLAVRQFPFLVYIFYESINTLYVAHIEGFTFQYLWPDWPAWNAEATPLIASIGLVIGNIFAISYLDIRRHSNWMYRIHLLLIGLSTVAFLGSAFVSSRIGTQFTAPLLPLTIVVSILSASVALRRQHTLAIYFLCAWALFGISALLWSGTLLNWFSLGFDVFTLYIVTVVAQAIILSIGLADQVRRINRDYIRTQQDLIRNLEGRLSDARDRLQLEREKEEALGKIAERSRQLASASHDIHQPIQSMHLSLDSLKKEEINPALLKQFHQTLEHMESVLGSTLDEASEALRADMAQAPLKSVVAGELVRDMAAQFRQIARQKGLKLSGFESHSVLVVRDLPLRRCLANLLSNALSYTDEGGVLIGARRHGDKLLFQVWDTGPGMDPAELHNLMEPLNKGEASSGHGIGLAIVKEICDSHGWQLQARSKPGVGSCFTLTVPVRQRGD
ncbi:MAG: sensor histidine kinase [Pseudomonadales bacterium]|nr:sensor histidine kinase [Pseudomonadales bacterium]